MNDRLLATVALTEAELKSAVEDYLQYGMNQGKWYYDRLNSGEVIVERGGKKYKIQLCREGTADFFVLTIAYIGMWMPRIIFLELKSEKGRMSPEQGAFKKMAEGQLAEYYVVRSIEELESILRRVSDGGD